MEIGDLCIAWDIDVKTAVISMYIGFGTEYYPYRTNSNIYVNAIKWDGSQEQFSNFIKQE